MDEEVSIMEYNPVFKGKKVLLGCSENFMNSINKPVLESLGLSVDAV